MMRRMVGCAVGLLVLLAPVTAAAKAPTSRHAGVYEYVYRHAQAKFGKRAPGRNIIRDGRSDGRRVTDAAVLSSTAVLERLLYPPPAPAVVYVAPASSSGAIAYQTPYQTQAPAGAGGVPSCASESGTNYSTGPANTNASSGASGRYQIMPFHWSTDCAGLTPTPSGQDRCAAIIYRNSGAGAWVGCGG